MTDTHPALLSEADYRNIEDELEGSEKGRRFLRAYLERNRSAETQALLRSIARLHRVAVGEPGFTAEVQRDVKDVLRNIVQLRHRAQVCRNDTDLSLLLLGGLHEVEACLMALSEAWDERSSDSRRDGAAGIRSDYCLVAQDTDRNTKLFGELSSLFSTDARCGPEAL